MATGIGETLHRSPRNPESFRTNRRAFRLVPADGGLLVLTIIWGGGISRIFLSDMTSVAASIQLPQDEQDTHVFLLALH